MPAQSAQYGVRRTLVAVSLIVLLATGAAASAQMLDRILAVVGGEPIMLSDVNAALTLGLVTTTGTGTDREQQALDALIDRRLQLIEVNRYVPPEPTETEIAARLAEVRARFPTDGAFEAALKETGVSQEELRARARDTLRIGTYLQQRFGAAYQPSEEEITRYYRSHEADFARNGVTRPYPEVREDARTRLIQERSASLIRDWVAGLRRRVDVTVLPK